MAKHNKRDDHGRFAAGRSARGAAPTPTPSGGIPTGAPTPSPVVRETVDYTPMAEQMRRLSAARNAPNPHPSADADPRTHLARLTRQQENLRAASTDAQSGIAGDTGARQRTEHRFGPVAWNA